MTTDNFITDLFCRIDERMKADPDHGQAALWPSEIVTIGILFALKGVGGRAFYRWLSREYGAWFPPLTKRTRLFRHLQTDQSWTFLFLTKPSLLGIADNYGIELIRPLRRGRSPQPFSAAGVSNPRWIVGAKWCVAVNHLGQIIGWVWAPANAQDTWFHPLIEVFKERTVLLADTGFHAQENDPSSLKLCRRGEWNERMSLETVLLMFTVVCLTKKMCHRLPDYFQAHLALMVAAFNVLIGWCGLAPDEDGFVPLSIAEFSL